MKYFVVSVALLASCSSDEREDGVAIEELLECPETFDDGTHHVVVVRDASIDPRLPVFAGKVNGCYSIVCKDRPSDSPTKAEQLARLAEKNTDCHLEKNLRVVRSSTLDNLADARTNWNQRVLNKASLRYDQTERIWKALSGEDRFNYHGTQVASTIAFDNPNVRFVFIKDSSIGRAGEQPKCPTVAEIDEWIRLLTDPELIAAYVAAPTSTQEDALVDIYRRHRVTIINESYGPLPVAEWEKACPGPRLREYIVAAANIEAERRKTLESTLYAGLHVLTVRSAGNHGATLQNSYDHYACIAPDATRGVDSADLLIGAYRVSLDGTPLSEFTNRGLCVDAYAPGEAIIAAFPAGWLAPWNGTSFAAPLIVRLLTQTQSPSTTPKQLRAAVLAARDSEGRLPLTHFDGRMIYSTRFGGVMGEFRSLRSPVRFED